MRELLQLSKPTETFPGSATAQGKGAPGLPGELRSHNHPIYGYQIYRLLLNESGGSIAVGEGVSIGVTDGTILTSAGALASVTSKSSATTIKESFGGVAVASVANDYWGWFLCYGEGLVALSTDNVAADLGVYQLASGLFDDGAAGTICVGVFLETMTTDSGTPRAFIRAL